MEKEHDIQTEQVKQEKNGFTFDFTSQSKNKINECQIFNKDSQPSTSFQALALESSRQGEIDKRMREFIIYFVKEFEVKMHAYNLILEGEVKKPGKISDTLSGIIGQTAGGTIGGVLGLFLGSPVSGAKFGSTAGETLGKKLGSIIGNDQNFKKVTALSDLIDLFLEDKVKSRLALIETAIDVFQSFELQFMRVSVDHTSKKAMQLLAKDAVNRAISYCSQNKEASFIDGILLGKSKIEPTLGVPIFSDKVKTPGFQLDYECTNCKSSWNTSSLYHKVGLVIEKVDSREKTEYYEKKDKSSKTRKYGYRRLFLTENWNSVKDKYRLSNVSPNTQFTDYQYILSLNSRNIFQLCNTMMAVVNQSNKTLGEIIESEKLEEILEESLENIIKEIRGLRDIYRDNEQYDILVSIETTLKNSCTNQYLDMLKQQLDGVRQEIEISIEKGRQENREGFSSLSHKLDELLIKNQVAERGKKIWFNMKEPVKNFTGRANKLTELHKALRCENELVAVSQIASLIGLGGVGKTELARRYAYDKNRNGDSYWNNAIWINAETYGTLSDSFRNLAEKLKVPIKEFQCMGRTENMGEIFEREIRHIIEDIYDILKNAKVLIIFDNVNEYQDIQEFLPSSFSPGDKKPYILITSRNADWEVGKEGKIAVIKLDDFNPKEARDFVKVALCIENGSEDIHVGKLAESLQRFPLALEHATAYIKEKRQLFRNRSQLEYGIGDYLKEFSEERKRYDLLCFRPKDSRYSETLFTAWMITFYNIRETSDSKNLALEVLSMISYLAPEEIDVKLIFFPKVVANEEQMWNAFELLNKYSMIKLEKGVCSIHRLLQQVIRLQKQEMQFEKEILEKTLILLTNTGGIASNHIVTVWEHASKYDVLVRNFIHSTYNKRNILYLLAERGNMKLIGRLSESLDPVILKEVTDAKNKDGLNALLTAALNGHLQTVKYLVEKLKCDINVKTYRDLWSPLHLAAYKGHLDIVKYLIDLNSNFNTVQENGLDIEAKTIHGFTPLQLASYSGYLHVIKYLVEEKKADLNAKANGDWTPLHFSTMEGNLRCMIYLLEVGADCHAKSVDGCTLLHVAANQGHTNLLFYLIEMRNLDINQKLSNGQTPLHCAAEYGHLDVVMYLVENHKADLHDKDDDGNTPLHLAAFNGHLHVIKYFMEDKTMAWNLTNKRGINLLHIASYSGHLDIVKYLVETQNADFRIKSDQGLTPLQCAVINEQYDTVEYFIKERGAFVLSRKDDETLLHKAVRGNEPKIILLVLEEIKKQDIQNSSIHINIKDDDGNTPLMCAARNGNVEAINFLLNHDADINSKNTEGETAMSLAAKGKHWEAVTLLKSNDAKSSMLNTQLKHEYLVNIKSQSDAHDLLYSSESEYYSLSSSSDNE